HLADVARRALEIAGEDGLNGIHDHHRRTRLGGRGEDRLQVRLAQQRDRARCLAQSVGTQLDLERRLLSADVQRRVSCSLESCRDLQEDGALPDARLAANENHRARYDPAAKYEIELGDPRGETVLLGPVNL